jgi:hypothetical protein
VVLTTQPLQLERRADSLLLVRIQMHTLCDNDAAGVVLQVEQVLHILGHLCPAVAELLARISRQWRHAGSSWSQIRNKAIGVSAVSARRCSHMAVSARCTIFSTASSASLPMMAPVHGAAGSMGISTRTLQQFRPWPERDDSGSRVSAYHSRGE